MGDRDVDGVGAAQPVAGGDFYALIQQLLIKLEESYVVRGGHGPNFPNRFMSRPLRSYAPRDSASDFC